MTYTIVEPDGGGGWQIATINDVECKGLTKRSHPEILRGGWIGATNPPQHLAGKVICLEVTAPFAPSSAAKKRGGLGTVPTVDVEAKTATYTYAEVDKSIAERKAEIRSGAAARRFEIETGGIVRGGVAIATDLTSQAKLSGALQLVQDDGQRLIRWKAINAWVQLNATAVTDAAREVGLHVQAAFEREYDINVALDAVDDEAVPAVGHAALDLIDLQAGSIDGVGAWPSNS